jgi:hypothetical protein
MRTSESGHERLPRHGPYGTGAGVTQKEALMGDPKNIVIMLLLIGMFVLGYLYYDSQQNKVTIDVPGFKLEAK